MNTKLTVGMTTLHSQSEKGVGIPKQFLTKKFLICTVVMEVLSGSSVEHGIISAPVKICFNAGWLKFLTLKMC